ncbi:MAG TPA: hypothetical protein VN081_01265 [Dongiaceae bacterium]|nr:hypothetical protein [Dongiaceae bacterium]
MAQFYEGGAAHFDALVYARPHENTLQFLQHTAQNIYSSLTEAGKQFTTAARQFYDSIGLSYGARQLQALGRMVQGIWQNDTIHPMTTMDEFQKASPVMRRWIMAQPEVRQLYHDQRVEGYMGLYHDSYPGLVGNSHYDYRLITSGVVMETEKGAVARTWYEEKNGHDSTPTPEEKMTVQAVWERLAGYLKHETVDPTSIFGDERG